MRLDKLPGWLQNIIGILTEGFVVLTGLAILRGRSRISETPAPSEEAEEPEPESEEYFRRGYLIRRFIKAAVAAITVVAITLTIVDIVWNALNPGPQQPIPFSHRIHVKTKNLNCFFCHTYASRSLDAGMPPVDKCLLCHSVIATQFPPIKQISNYKRQGKGIPWQRVNRLPDFVQFNHQIHIARRIDCGKCHGNVSGMDRIQKAHEFNMGFCINCHWDYGATTDCYACHY